MICIIALIVFGILGIFSARYRVIAKEAFDCVFKRITFRKCTTGLDKRLKSQITGKMMKKAPWLAKFTYRYFEVLSWIFTALLIASLVFVGIGVYNYVVYGNCNGPQGGFCVYDVFSANKNETNYASCSVPGATGVLTKPNVSGLPFFGPENARLEVVEFGCFTCQYSRKAQPVVEKMVEKYGDQVKFYFIDFPLPSHNQSKELAIAAECARGQGEYWSYYARLFRLKLPTSEDVLVDLAGQQGLNKEVFRQCLVMNGTLANVEQDIALGHQAGIYGTPTFFIGNQTKVGPLTEKEFSKIIDEELEK